MKVYKTKKGYFYKEYKNGKKIRISRIKYLKLKKQKGGTIGENLFSELLNPNNSQNINKLSENKMLSIFEYLSSHQNYKNYKIPYANGSGTQKLSNAWKGKRAVWLSPLKIQNRQNTSNYNDFKRSIEDKRIRILKEIIYESTKHLRTTNTSNISENTLYINKKLTNYKIIRNNSNPRIYPSNQTINKNEIPYVYFTINNNSLEKPLEVFGIFNELIKEYFNNNTNKISNHISKLNEFLSRLTDYNRIISSYNSRLTDYTSLTKYNQINFVNNVGFIKERNGDSLIASISMGGIILNPANSFNYGGGSRNNNHEHLAYEENLCYQSNLLESLEVIYTDVCKIFQGISPNYNNGFGEENFLSFMAKDECFPGYLPTVKATAVTFNEFKYVKLGKNNFRELKTPYLRMILSIASPDMKLNNPKIHYYIYYRKQMIDYWKLVINSTIKMYELLRLENPRVLAVMPGDFIKHHSGRYYKPRIELAIAASEALKIAISETHEALRYNVIFARETKETQICNEILQHSMDKNLKSYKQTDHSKLTCVKILKPTELFQIEAHQLNCPVIGYNGYKPGNKNTTFKSLAIKYPHTLFVFNDHIQGGGYGGQADIRGFRNAIGIPVGLYEDDKTFTLCKNNGNTVNRTFNLSKLDENTHVNYKAEPTGEFYFNIPFSQAIQLALHYLVLKFRGEYDDGFKFDRIVFGCESDGSLGAHHFAKHGNNKLLLYVRKQLDTLSSIKIEITETI